MRKRQVLLVGQPQLNEESAGALARKIRLLVEDRKPVLIAARDEASTQIASLLSHHLGVEPISSWQWDSRSSVEEPISYRQRIVERLRLPISSTEVVCVSPEVIKTVLELIRHQEEKNNVVLAVISVEGSLDAEWEGRAEGQCDHLILTTENLSYSTQSQHAMDSIVESLNKSTRNALAGTFLRIISMFTDADPGVPPAFDFSPTLTDISRKYSVVQARLQQLEATTDGTYTKLISDLKTSLKEINHRRLAQTEACKDLLESFNQIKTRAERVMKTSSELQSQSDSLKIRSPKSLAVNILSLTQDSRSYLIVNVQLVKHRSARYQIAYFPPAVSLDIVALRPSSEKVSVPLASVHSFPPGEYEVFFHKEGNVTQVKSNRYRFFIELQEGQTPMG